MAAALTSNTWLCTLSFFVFNFFIPVYGKKKWKSEKGKGRERREREEKEREGEVLRLGFAGWVLV